MNKNKDGSGNRTVAIIVFLIITLSVPFFIYFINIILTAITDFLNTHLPSALRTVLAFLIDGESIADEILNPLCFSIFWLMWLKKYARPGRGFATCAGFYCQRQC